jgi:hypothetical protein
MKVFVACAAKALRILGNAFYSTPAVRLGLKQARADEMLSTK